MNSTQIDSYILESLTHNWRKVAMVIGGALISDKFDSHSAEEIAERIQVLVAQGKLEVVGDLNEWRFCEIRLAEGTSNA